jgi:hypothetical protein
MRQSTQKWGDWRNGVVPIYKLAVMLKKTDTIKPDRTLNI